MLTEPERWSAAAVYQATRIFTSALKEKMAQRFLNQVWTWAFLVNLECPKRFMQLLTTKIYLLRWSFKKLWIWFFSIKIARIWIIRYSNEICHLIFDVNDDFQICNQRKVVRGKRETRQKIDSNFGFWRRLEDSLDPKTILWCKNVVERFFAFVVAAKFPACVHVGIVSWR